MAEEKPDILFSDFMGQFRQQQENNDGGATLDEQVDSLLSSSTQSSEGILHMDQPPRDEIEFLIFDAVIARTEKINLLFGPNFDASHMPLLLSRLRQEDFVDMITLGAMPLTGSHTIEIFEKMLNIGLEWFTMFLREDYGSEVIRAFHDFIQESSIRSLSLACAADDCISTEVLQSICTGILNSSVKILEMIGLKVRGDNAQRAHEILAEMILDSSSPIENIKVYTDVPGDISIQALSRALCQHPGIRNLDVSFRIEDQDWLDFDRNPWWKRLLAMDDLPLNLWPLLLKKADTWKCDASHSHLDVLYFLLREKNDVVLRNVRR